MSFEELHWKSGYETGVPEIDLQHRFFLGLINRLHAELTVSVDADYRARLFQELSNYARFHFISEENLMIKFGYPGLERHLAMHRQLIDELSWRAQEKTYDAIFDFLVRWFVAHTVEEDARIGQFLALAPNGHA
jgi:hemerythrin